jgi:hypothetical protein
MCYTYVVVREAEQEFCFGAAYALMQTAIRGNELERH